MAVNPHEEPDEFIMQQLTIDPENDAIVRIPMGLGDHSVNNNFSEVRVRETNPYIPPPERPPENPVPS